VGLGAVSEQEFNKKRKSKVSIILKILLIRARFLSSWCRVMLSIVKVAIRSFRVIKLMRIIWKVRNINRMWRNGDKDRRRKRKNRRMKGNNRRRRKRW